MKGKILIATSLLGFLVSFIARPAHAELVGGSIQTHTKEINLHHQNGSAALMMGSHSEPILVGSPINKAKGSLYVVTSAGVPKISTLAYKDKRGVIIAKPTSAFDKVIYLDASGKIKAGLGLSTSEIKALASSVKMTEAAAYASFLQGTTKDILLNAIDLASNNLVKKDLADENSVLDEMVADINFASGKTAANLVDDLLLTAETNEIVPTNMNDLLQKTTASSQWLDPVVTGVGVACSGGGGDNGGPGDGFVASGGGGDNGGPGDGFVASGGGGDNGGPGDGYVLEGWKGAKTPSMPMVKGLNARTAESYIFLF